MNNHRNPDGTYNGVSFMAEVTGLPRKTVAEIAAEVRVNQQRLRGCVRHDFEPLPPLTTINQRHRCIHCDGEIDYHAWYWHEQGRRP